MVKKMPRVVCVNDVDIIEYATQTLPCKIKAHKKLAFFSRLRATSDMLHVVLCDLTQSCCVL